MITFDETINPNKILINANLNNWPLGVPTPGFSKLGLERNAGNAVLLAEGGQYVKVSLLSGMSYTFSYQIIDESENINSNEELFNKLFNFLG